MVFQLSVRKNSLSCFSFTYLSFFLLSSEFFYIQIEKYARQYLAEGVRKVEDLIITTDSDLYRVLNLHYNRSNQIEVSIRQEENHHLCLSLLSSSLGSSKFL